MRTTAALLHGRYLRREAHPRAIGAFRRILERYARERNVLSPELLSYKAAGNPADIFGLRDRSYVREGYTANLVAFDLDSMLAHATYQNPFQFSAGMEYVLVGGESAVRDGELTGERNGDVLRSYEECGGATRPELDRVADD